MNTLKAWILMGALSVLLVLLGNQIGGQSGAILFFLISLGMNFFSYYFSDKMVIAMTGSRPVTEAEAPELYAMVRKLTQRAGLPMPSLYITPSPQPNAFATGRNPANSAVAVTEGLLGILNKNEIEGVLAHEIAHIKNRDILIGTIAAAFAGAITMIANVIQWGAMLGGLGRSSDGEEGGNLLEAVALAIVAPLAAVIIQMAISRSREYLADESGARLAGDAQGLANALLKLEHAAQKVPMQVNPAASHMFIVNPLSGESLMRLFSTHPPIEERVRRLQNLRI
ncbi:MAG TPA: zinc metalloprotease HtpX [Syntrophothermus lipocalidus]|nr:zinc metalloprotease HtpX [Syntrophothermus lipocalidus]